MSSKNEIKDVDTKAVEETVEAETELKEETAEAETELAEDASEKKYHPDVKNIVVLLIDYWTIIGSYLLSLIFLSEINFYIGTLTFLSPVVTITPFCALGTIVLYYIVGLYPEDYDEVGVTESRRTIFVTAISVAVYAIIMNRIAAETFPHIFFIMGGTIQLITTLFIRFFKRLVTPTTRKK